MNKDNGYWVRVLDEEKASILISLNLSYCSDVAIIKVADDTYREGFAYLVEDYAVKLDKAYLRPLSFVDALNLNMEHDAKWRDICSDCLTRELVDREVAQRCVATIDWGNGKDFSTNTHDMNIFNNILRKELEDLHQFANKAKSFKFEPRKVSHGPQLPDEIDLYNFFEKYKGHAKCHHIFGHVVCCYTLNGYVAEYKDSDRIEYFIGYNRYHAIKFKDRGTFLVSEKRYKELKARKGCTV
jgi:hypothetical protein